jgi:hypothetical protein
MVEQIIHLNRIYAIIVRSGFDSPGVNFFTPDDFSQQLAYMHHPKGKIIQPHVHNPVQREVTYTLEVLFIKKGKIRIDFFSEEQVYFESRILSGGDVVLLARGGHGFEILEEIEMIEVKQGPYANDKDKTRFLGNITKLIIP